MHLCAYANIRGVLRREGVKRQLGGRRQRFLVLSVALSSESSEIKLLYGNIYSPSWLFTDSTVYDLE